MKTSAAEDQKTPGTAAPAMSSAPTWEELMAEEPSGEEESADWARRRAQELGIILMKNDSGYKGVQQSGSTATPYTAMHKESKFVTKVLSGHFYSAEAAALALAFYERA